MRGMKITLPEKLNQQLFHQVMDDLVGYGPIQQFLDDPSISEVMVNGPQRVFIERNGELIETGVTFQDDAHVLRIINRMIHPLGRRVDAESPTVDARLPDGSRVNAVVPPVSIDGPCITIRKFLPNRMAMEDLIALGSITDHMVEFLKACVAARLNILISGGTSSGKTTMLNILTGFIPGNERIITIEDAVELQLHQRHVVRLETQPAGVDGSGAVSTRDLVRNALRMRPDRIVVGEVRSGEALDMLQAMNTGHTGSLTTLHANTPAMPLPGLRLCRSWPDLNCRSMRSVNRSHLLSISLSTRRASRMALVKLHRSPRFRAWRVMWSLFLISSNSTRQAYLPTVIISVNCALPESARCLRRVSRLWVTACAVKFLARVKATDMSADYHVGIDIGGTFTDFVFYSTASGEITTFKVPSTPTDPAQAVLQGLQRWFAHHPTGQVRLVHGSTVATNALLEHKGAVTALVTTRGFKDVLEIGRQNRPVLYDLAYTPHQTLIPAHLRLEVEERVNRDGFIQTKLDLNRLPALKDLLTSNGVESVAVCLLFSFLVNDHEISIANYLREAGFSVSSSCEILPEYREYERLSTTTINAYVSPVLSRYLNKLGQSLPQLGIDPSQMRVMQSNGGIMDLDEAARYGVRCILSGPAGGIIGAQTVFEQSMKDTQSSKPLRLMTFDMGGTSTDVSLIDRQPGMTTEAIVGGYPIRIPLLDIHTIGAGGGSIAYLDAGGALRVGPQSAGADPGPACYGHGWEPTVTDANLVLGRIQPDYFLGGEMRLDVDRAEQAVASLGEKLNLGMVETALGILEVANAHMERALRLVSVERGYDPQDFDLLSFGGAGGLHAAQLAARLRIRRVIVPPLASTLSALGMLAADAVRDYTCTVMFPGDIAEADLLAAFVPLENRALVDLEFKSASQAGIHLERTLDMRYRGQSYELQVPFSPAYLDHFHNTHHQAYGFARPDQAVEIVNIRLRATVPTEAPVLPRTPLVAPEPQEALLEHRTVYLDGSPTSVPCYRGEGLKPGNRLQGPALVLRSDTVILLPVSFNGILDMNGNLWMDYGYAKFNDF